MIAGPFVFKVWSNFLRAQCDRKCHRLPQNADQGTISRMEKTREIRMKTLLQRALQDAEVYLENESNMHSVPKDSETHFKLLIVSDKFVGLSKVARQRLVYSHLDSEFKSGLHALTLRAVSFEERKNGHGDHFVSPECLGGKAAKHETKF